LLPDVVCVIGAGSYVDVELLMTEIALTELDPSRLVIDRNAVLITPEDRLSEAGSDLGDRIGSTCSGTGAAVAKRIARRSVHDLAVSEPVLRPYLGSATKSLRETLNAGHRVIVEGTQGFGLSVLHSPHFPNTTSRDTTAAGVLAEAGLSPLDVDQVVLVLRAFPIRVAGNSGRFNSEEITWEIATTESGHNTPLAEFTSVTKRLRRIARFDAVVAREAIAHNRPSMIVLNHLDYVDARASAGTALPTRCTEFVDRTAREIGQPIDLVGLGPDALVPYGETRVAVAA
jgi:adenylosuccinate synthase